MKREEEGPSGLKVVAEVREWYMGDWFIAGLTTAGLFAIGLALWAAAHAVLEPAVVTSCYVKEQADDRYVILGYIRWGDDRIIASAKTPLEAQSLLVQMCPASPSEKKP